MRFANWLLAKASTRKYPVAFTPGARAILAAIAVESAEELQESCRQATLEVWLGCLLAIVKWAFNRPIWGHLLPGDIPQWTLGKDTDTNPLCMALIDAEGMVDCEQCPVDMVGCACWLDRECFMRTLWHGKPKYFVRRLLVAYARALRRRKYERRKEQEGRKPKNRLYTPDLFFGQEPKGRAGEGLWGDAQVE